jgi:hypothetical protein
MEGTINRKLDIEVVEKVFDVPMPDGTGKTPYEIVQEHWDYMDGEWVAKPYSCYMNFAAKVLDRMSSTTKEYWTLEVFSTGAVATFSYEGGRDLPWKIGESRGEGDELAEAICRAAVSAADVKKTQPLAPVYFPEQVIDVMPRPSDEYAYVESE